MVYGLDTMSNVTKIVDTIKNKGYSFVIRYYSVAENSKRTTAAELAAIGKAGLKRVVVYQNLHNSYDKFSSSIAQKDAADAINQAKSVGQPSSAIYFAVDYDATNAQINGNIKTYFKILKTKLADAGYSLGVYGSGLTCKILQEAGIVDYTWLAMASDWGNGTNWSDWNIRQTVAVTVGGIDCDKDEAHSTSGIGAW